MDGTGTTRRRPSAAAATWALLRCTHLEASLAVTAFAAVLALASGRGAGAALVAAAVCSGQFSVGWANDWIDADRDRAAGRRDKPVVRGDVPVARVRRAALAALAACVVLSLANGLVAGGLHLLAVASAWAYDLRLKATAASVVPYAVSFGLLPVFVVVSAGRPLPWWLPAAGAALGAGAHFVNVLPDLADDAAAGIRGLPQRLGAGWSLVAAALCLGTAALLVGAGSRWERAGPALLVAVAGALASAAAAVVVGARRRSRAAFLLAIATAGCVVVAFVLGQAGAG
ncbi:MAG TPA: UbiA family prenyltransferase [Egibacteraceae bacterium]